MRFILIHTKKEIQMNFFSRDFDLVMKSLSDAWNRAEHWSTRRQILAIVAADLNSSLIKQNFSGASDWQIKMARRHAFSIGRALTYFSLVYMCCIDRSRNTG